MTTEQASRCEGGDNFKLRHYLLSQRVDAFIEPI